MLTLLFLLLAVIALGTLACVPGRGDAVTIACRVVSGACAAAGLAALAGGAAPASLTLPFGLPGEAFVFSVDVVSLAFLPAVGVALAADGRPALAAGALLFLCAGDAALSVVGASLAALAAGWRGAVPVLALLLALGLLSLLPGGAVLPQDALAALRVPGQATPVLLLAAAPGLMLAGSVRGGAALPCLGLFLLVRVLLDLPGAGVPFGFGLAVAAVSLAGAVERGLRGLRSETIDGVARALGGVGFMLAGASVGIASAARAADLGEASSAAFAAALLLVWVLGAAVPLALLTASRLAEGAGSWRLQALGGLLVSMRPTSLLFLLAVGSLAGLPPGAGWAPFWLVLQALLSAQRFGGIAAPIVLAGFLASVGLALGLSFAAAGRVWAVAFLGRPRTPRASAAFEPAGLGARRAIAGVAGLVCLLALVPGLAIRLLDPATAAMTGVAMAGRAGVLALRAASAGTQDWPLLLASACVLPGLALLRAGRRLGWRAEEEAWDGGAGPPPEWLPFGEPSAQPSAPGVARPVLIGLGLAAGRLPGEGGAAHEAPEASRTALATLVRGGRRLAGAAEPVERMLLEAAPVLLAAAAIGLTTLAALRVGAGGR